MLEIIRRVALLVGIGRFLWLWFVTPVAILEVKRADFAADYHARWGKRLAHPLTAAQSAEALIADDEIPSLAETISSATRNRLLNPAGADWNAFYRALPAGPVYYTVDQPPFAGIRSEIQTIYRQSGWISSYLPVSDAGKTGYIEVSYREKPRETHAPKSLIYPRRGESWLYLGAALVLYFGIPWRGVSGCAAYPRVAPAALDGLGAAFAATFFALALYVSPTTDAALGSEFGLTVFLWCLGAPGLLMVLWAARTAAFRISAGPTGLVVQTLWGGRDVLFQDASAVGRLTRSGIAVGVYIRSRAGDVVRLSWTGLMRFQIVLDALYRSGLPAGEDLKA
jgi:hypothetical protein